MAIGDGWQDGAWVDSSWAVGAWFKAGVAVVKKVVRRGIHLGIRIGL